MISYVEVVFLLTFGGFAFAGCVRAVPALRRAWI